MNLLPTPLIHSLSSCRSSSCMATTYSSYQSLTILSLPNELIAQISGYCAIWHPESDHVIDIKGLSALSRTCRRMRDNTLAALYTDAVITSQTQLRSLSKSPKELLHRLRYISKPFFPRGFLILMTPTSEHSISSWMSTYSPRLRHLPHVLLAIPPPSRPLESFSARHLIYETFAYK